MAGRGAIPKVKNESLELAEAFDTLKAAPQPIIEKLQRRPATCLLNHILTVGAT